MTRLARKIKKDEKLYLRDLKVWIGYNFLVFNEEERENIRRVTARQLWFWKWFMILVPPYWMGAFAVARYQVKWGKVKAGISATAFIIGLSQLGLVSSNSEMGTMYDELYAKYQYEVLSPKYRGLKLKPGKKVDQIDDREFTSGNFDDLKELIFKQRT